MPMNFSVRNTALERMDTEPLPLEVLESAYTDINTCNRLLGGDAITLRAVWQCIRKHPQPSYTILDVGCGDGSMMRSLSRFLRARQVAHTIVGVDLKQSLLDLAAQKSQDFPELRFQQGDILDADAALSCDILMTTLTLHHVAEAALPRFLHTFVRLARIGVVINDLQRSKVAYRLFQLFSLFFLKNRIAIHDGLVSITRGFTKKELVQLSKTIPDATHTIRWKWAFRYVWILKTM